MQNYKRRLKHCNKKPKRLKRKADLATERAKKAEQAVNSASKNAKEIEALKREAAQAKAEAEKAKKDAANALNNIDGKIQDALKRAEEEQIKADKARQENIKNLTKVAEKSGLNRWQAQDLAYKHSGLNEQEFRKFLVERKAKIEELNKLAIANGLQDWQANNFALEYFDKEKSEAEAELKRLKEEREKSEKEQLAREKKRQELKELALADGMDNWQADNFASEFADKEKSEAEAELKKRKEERIAYENKRKEFIALAEEKGLSDGNNFVSNNALELSKEEFVKKVEERITEIAFQNKRNRIDSLTITTPLGFHGQFEERTVPIFDDQGFDTGKTKLESYKDIYNQQFSIVVGEYRADNPYYSVDKNGYTEGFTTAEKSMPTEGSATYQGVAFTHNKQGKLNYTVNFSTKEGEGKITELTDIGTITLEKGTFGKRYDNHYMSGVGNAVAEDWKNDNVTGKYSFEFYGPKAEEIAGKVVLTQDNNYDTYNQAYGLNPKKLRNVAIKNAQYKYNNTESFDIGFGGTRGEIKK